MKVHLVDGTYELFRYHFALPSHITADGREVAATRGVVGTVLQMLEEGATHVGVATDHVIESFRNDLWPGYKTSEGMPADLLPAVPAGSRRRSRPLGVTVFPMVEFEADDAMGAAAAIAAADERVEQVLICTPDKDLGQCVRRRSHRAARPAQGGGARRRRRCGRSSASTPSRSPTTSGWSATRPTGSRACPAGAPSRPPPCSPATATSRTSRTLGADWDVNVRGGGKLAVTLRDQFDLALLFRRIATLELDAPTIDTVDELEWKGPRPEFVEVCERIDAPGLVGRGRQAWPTPALT